MGVPSAASKQLECEYSCAPGAVRRGNFAGAAPGVPMGDGCTRTYAVTAPHLEHFLTVVAGFMAIMNPLANTPIFLGLTEDATPDGRRKIARQATVVAFLVVAVFAALGQLIFSAFGITVGAFRIAGGIVVFMIGYHMLQGEHSKVQHTPRARKLAGAHLSAGDEQAADEAAAQAAHVMDKQGLLEPSASRPSHAIPLESDAAFINERLSRPSEQGVEDGGLSVGLTPLAVPILAGPGTIATAIGFTGGGTWPLVVSTIVAFAVVCFTTWICFVGGQRLVGFLGRPFLTVVTRLMGLILAVIGVQMFLEGLKQAGY